MSRFEHKIPAILNPVGDICVEVTIPAHPDYVALFVRAVRQLENNRLYQRDEVLGADVKIVQEQWRNRTVTPLIEALASGTGMCGVDGECLAYPPFAGFISFFPQNPYTEPDLIPEGFLAPPFYVNGMDNEHDLPNYNRGDVIVNFAAINLELSWDLEKTPRIELCLEGSGVVELHLLKTVQGGTAIITVDNPLDLGDIIAGIIDENIEIISLNQDIISLPPETAEEVIIEREITTEGEHTLYIYYLPTLDDSLIPLFFGGGLREISLCGNIRPCGMPAPEPPPPLEGVEELKPEFQFTADCGLEYRLRDQEDNIVQEWQPVPGWVDNAAACFGAGAMTTEEMCEAIECGVIKVAQRILTGESGIDFSVVDGEVISGGTVEDDPETELDESLAAAAGGAIAIRLGFNELWGYMNTWYNAGATETEVLTRLLNLYELNVTELSNFVADYFANRVALGTFPTTHASTLDSYMFCKGHNLGIYSKWVIDTLPATGSQQISLSLAQALKDEQLEEWYQRGLSVPSSDYMSYSCTKIQTEEFTLDLASADTPQYITNGVWKAGHRMLIEVTGTYTDTDNPTLTGDGMYVHDSSTGSKTFNSLAFNFGGAVVAPAQANVPYSETHSYAFTVEKAVGTGNVAGIISKLNAAMLRPNRTGILAIKVTDLGEFAL